MRATHRPKSQRILRGFHEREREPTDIGLVTNEYVEKV